jgi:hypothetical protein
MLIVSVLVSIQLGSSGVLASENEDPLTRGKKKKYLKQKLMHLWIQFVVIDKTNGPKR